MNVLLKVVSRLWTNWLTLVGSVIATVAAAGTVVLFFSSTAAPSNPYVTALLLVALPALFIFGLLIIPLGFWWQRRRAPAPGSVARAIAGVLQDRRVAASVLFVVVASLANVIIVAGAAEKTVKYMGTAPFCGTSCHAPMEPEWTAYQQSPHANVACDECHVGSGVGPAVDAKLNGISQLVHTLKKDYPRPIPSPVAHMRGAADTCLKCHSATQYYGAVDRLYPRFKDDERNTPSFDVMRLFVGGRNPATHQIEGAHTHADPNKTIRYEMIGENRTRMGKMTVLEGGKVVAEYARASETGAVSGERTMDCLDCHNHPAHQLEVSASGAVDQALYAGSLDRHVPFMRKTAEAVLVTAKPPRLEAEAYFKNALTVAYHNDHPAVAISDEAIRQATTTVSELYRRSNFPDMKITWGTYPSQLDHRDDRNQHGCFRCHDSDYKAIKLADGHQAKLSQSCDLCHAALATDGDPEKFDDTLSAMFPVND